MTDIPIESEAHWHSLRSKHGGASEAAALCGESPWLTEFQLYHQKAGTLPPTDFSDNAAVNAGRFFEPAIAAWASEKWADDGVQWPLRKVHRYIECGDCPEMGASLDFEESDTGVPVEIKWSVYGQGWEY